MLQFIRDMKQKQVIIIGVVVLLLALGIGYFVQSSQQSKSPQTTEASQVEEDVVQNLSAKELGLSIETRNNNKEVKFVIANPKGISVYEYEISYTAEGSLPRGLTGGPFEVEPDETKIDSGYKVLGSCSSGKCKYDTGISEIKLVLKITKTDGKVYSAEQTLEL